MAEIPGTGGERLAFRADLSEEGEVVAVIESATARFGRLDVLHNNAALTDSDFLSPDTAVTELSVDVWDRTMAVNLRSQMLMCKHAVPIMAGGAAVPSSTCPLAPRSRATAPGPPTGCRRPGSTP